MHLKHITRVEKLFCGIEKKTGISLDQINCILVLREEKWNSTESLLDSQNHPPLVIAHDFDLPKSKIESLDTLGKKIDNFLNKPVIARLISDGEFVSNKVIQP